MRSKTLFFNRGIFLHSIKQFSWICIAYFAALFVSIPLPILMNYDNENLTMHYHTWIQDIFNFQSPIPSLLTIVIPVLTAIFLFRYMHVKKAADLFHSIPVKREKIYDSNIFIGILFLTIPLVLISIICVLLNISLNLGDIYTLKEVFVWLGIMILLNITIFLSSVFVAMNTGISIAQGALTYIFLLLPVGITALLAYNLEMFIYGFNPMYYFTERIVSLSPLTKIFDIASKNVTMTGKEIIIYLLLCVCLYWLSRYLYKIRKIESYSHAIAFPKLEPVFKYGVTFCTMLVSGIYFSQASQSIKWTLFGYIIGSLIGYFIAQIILKKSIYVFKDVKGYIPYIFIIALLLLFVKADVFGYQKYMPQTSNIKGVYFNQGFFYPYVGKDATEKNQGFYFKKENIQNIMNFHKEIIENRNRLQYNSNQEDWHEVSFAYQLKNGKKIIRSYRIPYENYSNYFKPIYESMEYKQMNYPVLRVASSNVAKINIESRYSSDKKLTLTDPIELQEALNILKGDIQIQSYEDMESPAGNFSVVRIFLLNEDEEIGMSIDKTYKNFEDWLRQKGYIEKIKLMPADIKYLVVEERTSQDTYTLNEKEENKNSKRLEIRDKKQIEECLSKYTERFEKDSQYIIGFYLENGDAFYATFFKNDIPDFITKVFK